MRHIKTISVAKASTLKENGNDVDDALRILDAIFGFVLELLAMLGKGDTDDR